MRRASIVGCEIVVLLPVVSALGCGPIDRTGGPSGQRINSVLREVGDVEIDEGRPNRPIVGAVLSGRHVTNATMDLIGRCSELRSLELHEARVTDDGLRQIGHLTQLRDLWLDGIGITDLGLSQLLRLKNLETLTLYDTQVTNRGLAGLAGLPSLRDLWLLDATVDDDTLGYLDALTQIRVLHLRRCRVSDSGIERLQRAIPGIQIYRPRSGTGREAIEADLEQRRLCRRGLTGRLRAACRRVFEVPRVGRALGGIRRIRG
jgi:hypothetical protein